MGRRCDAKVDKKSIEQMTDAQKKSRARFKAAVTEAAKLRKKNPRLSQADAVKQAWAILYGKERAGKKMAGPKKPAKKTAKKKPTKAGERHTDTKSHNVNIRVMSGVKSDIKKRLKQSGKRLKHGYSIVPGDIRKISGFSHESDLKKLIDRRNFLETKINILNRDLYFAAHGISHATPEQRKKFREYKAINRKSATQYAKEYKVIVRKIEKINKV